MKLDYPFLVGCKLYLIYPTHTWTGQRTSENSVHRILVLDMFLYIADFIADIKNALVHLLK